MTQGAVRSRGPAAAHLGVAAALLGSLAAFAVPKFLSSMERASASRALAYLAALHEAQERHHALRGVYAADAADLDPAVPPPDGFARGEIESAPEDGLRTTWALTLTRQATLPGGASYTVTWSQDGFDPARSTIEAHDDLRPVP